MTPRALATTIVRYTANERTNHWFVAIAFVLAALSGLALFHPALFWLSESVRRRTVDADPASDHRADHDRRVRRSWLQRCGRTIGCRAATGNGCGR